MAKLTSIFYLVCLIGFVFSYIVYIKKAVPDIIALFADAASIPELLQANF